MTTPKIEAFVRKKFSNPWIGCISTVITLISLPLSIFMYFKAQRYPQLAYMVNPARPIVVSSERPGNLQVTFNDKPIVSRDVVAVQVQVWNAGRGSIRPESILSPVEIHLAGGPMILDAVVMKQSRDVVGLAILPDQHAQEHGTLRLTWKILEHLDGGIIQIVYSGQKDAHVQLVGTIEDQRALWEHSSNVEIESAEDQFRSKRLKGWQATLFSLGFILGGIEMIRRSIRAIYRSLCTRHSDWTVRLSIAARFAVLILGLAFILAGIVGLFLVPVPPLDFT